MARSPPCPRLIGAKRSAAGAQAELQDEAHRHDPLLEQHVGGHVALVRHPDEHHAAQEPERHPGDLAAPNSAPPLRSRR